MNSLLSPDGFLVDGIRVVQNFPWTAAETAISLVDDQGKEVFFVEDLDLLPQREREAVRSALRECVFAFEVESVIEVEEDVELRHWLVETTQGRRKFQTRSEDWPSARPGGGGLLLRDISGDVYFFGDDRAWDPRTRRWLEPFV